MKFRINRMQKELKQENSDKYQIKYTAKCCIAYFLDLQTGIELLKAELVHLFTQDFLDNERAKKAETT